ncbi:uncharacterized protein [Rutidosis leptorrhynchoides]|uniref:uncharacterized protein n=1 Tax=Rutidosis leptorrhynchoides TaxID=125765 RepID=UPI003A9A6670
MAALNLRDSFSIFDTSKLKRWCELYPKDFNSLEMIELEEQLDMSYNNIRKDQRFATLIGDSDLARWMDGNKKTSFFSFGLSVIKAVFYACVICAVEREALANVKEEDVIERVKKDTSP